jgi:hypothetical protein
MINNGGKWVLPVHAQLSPQLIFNLNLLQKAPLIHTFGSHYWHCSTLGRSSQGEGENRPRRAALGMNGTNLLPAAADHFKGVWGK